MYLGGYTFRRRARMMFTEWYVEHSAPQYDGYCLVLKDLGREYRFPFYGEVLAQGGWSFMAYMVDELADRAYIRW